MAVLFFIWFVFITLLCLVPFSISFLYFLLGFKSLITGKMEKSSPKINGGVTTIFISATCLLVIYFLWRWLCRELLSWEI